MHNTEADLNEATLATLSEKLTQVEDDHSINWNLRIMLHLIVVLLRRLVEAQADVDDLRKRMTIQESTRGNSAAHRSHKAK